MEWWDALNLERQIFYGIGIISMLVISIQILLMLLGLGGDALDMSGVDLDGGHSDGLGLFSVNTITAFFVGFGWGGVIALEQGIGLLPAVVIATFSGAVLMALMYGIMLGMMRMQSDGTRRYDSAVGAVATVYSTVPAAGQGSGQIEVLIGRNLSTASARTEVPLPLRPGEKVRIIAMDSATSFVIEPFSPESTPKS